MTPELKAENFAYKLIRSKVFFGEQLMVTEKGERIKFWPYQVKDLEDYSRVKVYQCGREVGKTLLLVCHALHAAMTSGKRVGLIAAPKDAHLSTIISYFEIQINNSAFIKAGIEKIERAPYYKVTFKNGFVLPFRMAGPHGEAFRSLHVDFLFVDEAAYFSERANTALSGCMNTGCQEYRYSTPDGRRDTHYYRMTKDPDVTPYLWPSWFSAQWTQEKEKRKIKEHNGKTTSGWLHEVAGVHGQATNGAFNMDDFFDSLIPIKNYDLIQINGDDIKAEVNARIAMSIHGDVQKVGKKVYVWHVLKEKLAGKIRVYNSKQCSIGADLGYTSDPAEVMITFNVNGTWLTTCRIHMEKVSYDHQEILFMLLIYLLKPYSLGIDLGSNGMAVCQQLRNSEIYRYLKISCDIRVEDILFGINFGGNIELDYENYDKDDKEKEKVVKEYNKPFMTSLLIKGMQGGWIGFAGKKATKGNRTEILCHDGLLERQFADHEYTTGENGRIIFAKGNDHIVDASRCDVQGRFLQDSKEGNFTAGGVRAVGVVEMQTNSY